MVATPNHDPHRARPVQQPTEEAVATLKQAPEAVGPMQQPTAETVATPNHDPHHRRPVASAALNPATVRAEPEPAAPSAPAFVTADTVLYAKDSARLRAAPGTSADILTKLAADAPLRATARSTDRAWWRVSLADGRTGYVHRTAVTRHRVVKTKLPEPVPVVAAAPAQPVPARNSQGLLSYVDDTMSWLADAAGRGSPPTAIRTER
jgi:uncharacterized protein YgiM (DUF1202 family)